MVIITNAVDRADLGRSSNAGHQVAMTLSLHIFCLRIERENASVRTTTNKCIGADLYSCCNSFLRRLNVKYVRTTETKQQKSKTHNENPYGLVARPWIKDVQFPVERQGNKLVLFIPYVSDLLIAYACP